MLKALRKNTKIIIWTVIVSFALWGGYSVGTSFRKEGRIAGEVFGKGVNFQEFNRFYRASQRFTFNGEAPTDPVQIRMQTWQNIIYSREAKRQRIEVSDDEVRHEITRIFSAQGVTDLTPQYYKRFLENALRETPQEFESQVREMLRIQKLMQRVLDEAKAGIPGDEQIQNRMFLDRTTLEADMATFETLEDAMQFYEKVHDDTDRWKEALATLPAGSSQKIAKTNILNLLRNRRISEQDARRIGDLKSGTVSVPVPGAMGYYVFFISNKTEASESGLDDTLRQQYAQDLINEDHQRRLLEWNIGVLSRADLKDYMTAADSNEITFD